MVRHGIVILAGDPSSEAGRESSRQSLGRVVGQDHTWEFILSWEPRIVITQDDVRQLQLAKGTILCGVRILMDELGFSQISAVAGAFGNASISGVPSIGMLPSTIPMERIQRGKRRTGSADLLSRSIRRRADPAGGRLLRAVQASQPRTSS
jgi:uncharacterized 2Fe-2S/4Fe-4S cluster protein (DUF4445 family)